MQTAKYPISWLIKIQGKLILSAHSSLGMNCVSLLCGRVQTLQGDAQKAFEHSKPPQNTKVALSGVYRPSFFLNTNSDSKINITRAETCDPL